MEIVINNENISFELNNIYAFIGDEINISNTKDIGYVKCFMYDMYKYEKVKDNLENELTNKKYSKSKRIEDSLKLVNLNADILNKNIDELTYIELKKLSFIMAVINNPQIIILENFTEGLSNGEKDSLSILLRMLKNKYSKIIILIGKDTDYYYRISDYIFLTKDKKIIKYGNKNILQDIELLNKNNIKVPYIVEFINEYKKHNKEFNDYNNILDLIKAIYRDIG